MCGITGAVWFDAAAAVDDLTLARMTDALRHRGPDDAGSLRSEFYLRPGNVPVPGVALGHRRLSIIDAAGGHQPLSNEDGSVWVVFNGEIYNFADLRRRLEGAGHTFRSACDTEVLVHLYEDEGLDFLKHLNGMFALALWDERRGRVILARDRLGKKPLVYRLERDRLLFASEIKSILQVPGVPRELDPQSLDAYLTYQYTPAPRTMFRGIAKLPPAHYAVYEAGRLSTGCYWRPDFNEEVHRPAAEYGRELRELLTSAVRLRMQSDVPLGAFLSGGVDSSLIVGLMQKTTNSPIKTFSIGFASPEYDETPFARLAAERFGAEHHELRVEAQSLDLLPTLAWHFDEPFGDSSSLPTYIVSKLASEHVTVALTGDGGDELFAGYPRYRAVKLAAMFDRLPRVLRRAITLPAWGRMNRAGSGRSLLRRLGRLAEGLGESPDRRYLDWVSIFNERRRADLYSDAFLAELASVDPFDVLAAALSRSRRRDPVTAASLADLVTYLPGDLLHKVDMASMAHGLECRQPLLDHRVVELAIRMPMGLKMAGGPKRAVGKRIVRETFADLLPAEILRRPKQGFGAPIAAWFRGDLQGFFREILLDPRALGRGYFRPEAVRSLFEEHQAGRFDHGYRLWSLVMLELWQRQWMDQAPTLKLDLVKV